MFHPEPGGADGGWGTLCHWNEGNTPSQVAVPVNAASSGDVLKKAASPRQLLCLPAKENPDQTPTYRAPFSSHHAAAEGAVLSEAVSSHRQTKQTWPWTTESV